ncbi:MAG TPA: hypothetical protein VFT50_01115 [Baekduia sp.]|nr:hypothetical protein [Baekduia sp.]
MIESTSYRITWITGAARLSGRGRTERRGGDMVVVDDGHGSVLVVVAGASAESDLHITGASRLGQALVWRSDRGETLAVVGTVRSVETALGELPGVHHGGGDEALSPTGDR